MRPAAPRLRHRARWRPRDDDPAAGETASQKRRPYGPVETVGQPIWQGGNSAIEASRPPRPTSRACGGPVAQWLELTAHNRLVAGSNPAGPTSALLTGWSCAQAAGAPWKGVSCPARLQQAQHPRTGHLRQPVRTTVPVAACRGRPPVTRGSSTGARCAPGDREARTKEHGANCARNHQSKKGLSAT